MPVENFVPFMDRFREILARRQDERPELHRRYVTPERHARPRLRPEARRIRDHPDEQRRALGGGAGARRSRDPAARRRGDGARRNVLPDLPALSDARAAASRVSQRAARIRAQAVLRPGRDLHAANSTSNMATPSRADAAPPRRRTLARPCLVAVWLLVLAAAVPLRVRAPVPGHRSSRGPPRPLVFAHRGFGDLAPDNSLYAVERALEAGMDGVDVDGQLTRDGELVIFHDLSVDRLTSDTGRVRDKTLAEMLALDLGPQVRPARYAAPTSGPSRTSSAR